MKTIGIWLVGSAFAIASQTASAQGVPPWNPDEHGNDKVSGTWDFPMPVDCYGDTLNVHIDWDLSVHTTANPGKGERWMFSQNWNLNG